MNKKECVIYKGNCFQIEWYYDAKGNSQPYEYYQSCDLSQKTQILDVMPKNGRFWQNLGYNKISG